MKRFIFILIALTIAVGCSKTETTPKLPVANIILSPGSNISAGATVQLSAVNSIDYYNRMLSYRWSIISEPAGSSAQLLNTNQAITYLIPDVTGSYVVQLVVDDGILTSMPVSATINAGSGYPNLSISYTPSSPLSGQVITLNASGSTDPNNKLLNFTWSFIAKPAGSNATINNANQPIANFIPDQNGVYVIELRGTNGMFTSTTQTSITVGSGVPVASFNFSPATANTGQVINLVSTSSDPNGYPLTYTYSFVYVPSGSKSVINNANQAVANFIPDVTGNYVIKLTVKDPYFTTFTQSTITISTSGVPYITYAGPTPQNTDPLSTVQVFGNAVNPNNNTMTYTWTFVSLPSGSSTKFINTGTAVSNITDPSFIADVQGQYVLSLTVKDNITGYQSTPSNVVVTALSPFWTITQTAVLYPTQTGWAPAQPISVF
ncbi:MAG: PKD domain-containing protein, partial [bacterium]